MFRYRAGGIKTGMGIERKLLVRYAVARESARNESVAEGEVKERSKQVTLIHTIRGPKRRNGTERSYRGKLSGFDK